MLMGLCDMAAQKRKTALVEDSPKRRRLDKGNKWTSVTSKKKKAPPAKCNANKSKTNVGKVQRKRESKSSVKPTRTLTKKAIQSARQKKAVQKRTQLSSKTPTKKTVLIKNLPIKATTLKSSSRTASTISKISHDSLSKSSQKNKTLNITKNSTSTARAQTKTSKKTAKVLCKSQAQSQLRPTTGKICAHETLSVQSAQHSPLKSKRTLNKTVQRATKLDVQAMSNRLRSSSETLTETVANNKTCLRKRMQSPKGDMTRKPVGRGAILSLQKSCGGGPRNSQKRQICRTARSLVATTHNVVEMDKEMPSEPRPITSRPVSDSRRSQRLQTVSDVSSKSFSGKGIKGKKSGQTTQNTLVKKGQVPSSRSGKLDQKKGNVAISSSKQKKKNKKEQEVSRNLKENKNKGVRKAQKEKAAGKVVFKLNNQSSCKTNQQQSKISPEQSLHQETAENQKALPVPCIKKAKGKTVAVQATTEQTNGGQKLGLKRAVCHKVKSKSKQRLSQLQESDIKPAQEPENNGKAKRISILELCEEIAGEIESDTVEVIKEVASTEDGKGGKMPEKPQQEHEEAEAQKLALCDPNQNNPSKCFFPSRKALPVKCKLNGKTSPTAKNSKWNKIKLKKASPMNQNHLTKHTALPNLELLERTKKAFQAVQCDDTIESHCPKKNSQLPVASPQEKGCVSPNLINMKETFLEEGRPTDLLPDMIRPTTLSTENGQVTEPTELELEPTPDETFRLHLESSPENTPEKCTTGPSLPKQAKLDNGEKGSPGSDPQQSARNLFYAQASETGEKRVSVSNSSLAEKIQSPEANIQKEIKKLKEAEKESDKQLIIDAGQKRFGAISCTVCGMLYTASSPEDETQHLFFHNQFISAVKYVGWKKERIVDEYPDGKMIMVFPDDPKYALKKVEEIREMVDNDLGFQQVPLKLHSRTKTLLFISNDKKVTGCLIAEHIQWGYRVIDEKITEGDSEKEKAITERQKAWCCSTSPEPAICGISRIWVFGMMRRKKIASRMLDCLRNNFIYGSYLRKDEIAFSDPTPDGKLFATQYCGTSQFLVYNFLNGQQLAN